MLHAEGTRRKRMGLVRDLTEEFKRLRNRAKSNRFGTDDVHLGEHRIQVPPGWTNTITDVELDITTITERMEQLRQVHQRHLLPGFNDRVDEEQEIEILTRGITKLFQQAYGKIKKEGMTAREEHPKETEMKRNIQSRLALELQDLSSDFKKAQQEYLGRIRGLESSVGGEEFELDEELLMQAQERGFDADEIALVEDREARAQEWEKEMKGILTSVQELNTIFKELSILIIEQGTIVDRIDYNIEMASHNLDRANENLEETKKIVKSSRTKMIIMFLLVLVALAAVVLFVKLVVTHVIGL